MYSLNNNIKFLASMLANKFAVKFENRLTFHLKLLHKVICVLGLAT